MALTFDRWCHWTEQGLQTDVRRHQGFCCENQPYRVPVISPDRDGTQDEGQWTGQVWKD